MIDSSLPGQYRVTDAMAHIEAHTGEVAFVSRTTQASYIRIVPSSGCSSYVGRQGGQQYLYLGSGCSTGNTIHELLHALGMYHEQSRCDRDGYVTIHWGNIQSGYSGNFNKHCTGATDVLDYDEGSIMHYGPYAFSANGQRTITSNRGLGHLMGQRSGMSSTDVGTVDWMYPPPLPPSVFIAGPDAVKPGQPCSWPAVIQNGKAPMSVSWSSNGTGSGNDGGWTGYSYNSPLRLFVQVTDAYGRTATASKTVLVAPGAAPVCLMAASPDGAAYTLD